MNTTIKIKLVSIQCHFTSEHLDDELSIWWGGNKIWPVKKKYNRLTAASTAKLDTALPIQPNQWVSLDLFEHNFFSKTKIGEFKMLVTERGGPYTTSLHPENRHSSYSMVWEVC